MCNLVVVWPCDVVLVSVWLLFVQLLFAWPFTAVLNFFHGPGCLYDVDISTYRPLIPVRFNMSATSFRTSWIASCPKQLLQNPRKRAGKEGLLLPVFPRQRPLEGREVDLARSEGVNCKLEICTFVSFFSGFRREMVQIFRTPQNWVARITRCIATTTDHTHHGGKGVVSGTKASPGCCRESGRWGVVLSAL